MTDIGLISVELSLFVQLLRMPSYSRTHDSKGLFEKFQNVLFIYYGLLGIVFILLEYNFTHVKIVIAGFIEFI